MPIPSSGLTEEASHRAPNRLIHIFLAALLATATLVLLVLLSGPLAAQPDPSGLLATATQARLNQAEHIQLGHDDSIVISSYPITPAQFLTPISQPHPVPTTLLEYSGYLPLVKNSRMVEARALWVTRWDYGSSSDVQALVENAAGAGFNMLLFQVRGAADAFYTPGLEPWSALLSGTLGQDPGWDPLQTAIEAAHAHNMELHAYVNIYPVWLGSSAPLSNTVPQHLFWTLSHRHSWDRWRAWTTAGESGEPTPMLLNSGYLWATPALSDVVSHVISVTADLITRYDVDGLHLDLVRYPGRDYSYDPFSVAAYSATLEIGSHISYDDWQRQQVTLLLNRVYSEVLPLRAGLRLSAAVWPVYQDYWGWGYKEGYSDYYQDSQAWLLSGTIDAIMPMIYPASVIISPHIFTTTQFSLLVSDFMAHDGERHVFPGMSAGYADFNEIAQRIAIARNLGASGHAIFSARLVAINDYWDEFAAGPYVTPADVPSMSWRP